MMNRALRIGAVLGVGLTATLWSLPAPGGSHSAISAVFAVDTRAVLGPVADSALFTVDTRGQVLDVSIAVTSPFDAWTVGSPIQLQAVVSGAAGPVSFSWDAGSQGEIDPPDVEDPQVTFSVEGVHRIELAVSDGSGSASAYRLVPVGKAPAQGEPKVRPAADPMGAEGRSVTGEPFTFDPAKIDNGLIVIIHGIWTSVDANEWMRQMGETIRARIPDAEEPNICLLNWEPLANPSVTVASALPSWIGSRLVRKRAADLLAIRSTGIAQGLMVAAWIREQIDAGLICTDAPIHIIAHSVGGFVAGEIAFRLQDEITQVSLLDTPFPIGYQWLGVKGYLNPGLVERYISSRYGAWQIDFVDPMFSSYYYRGELSPLMYINPLWGWTIPEDHSRAYEWYRDTIQNAGIQDGFWYSPFENHGFHGFVPGSRAWDGALRRAQESTASGLTNVVLDGFSSFGDVAETGGVYTVTENANAGIFREVDFPDQARSVNFMYRFLPGGEEDFLSVHVGSNDVVYVGANTVLSREADVYGEASVRLFAGTRQTLTFKLVSRGDPDARIEIHSISLTYALDSDGDGLGDDEETNTGVFVSPFETGTDPADPDTDGDGAGDLEEIAAGTDPNSRLDVFMAEAWRSEDSLGGVAWFARAGKTYRVLRSMDLVTWEPAPEGTDPNEASERTAILDDVLEYYDVESPGNPRAFYRVEIVE